MNSKIKTIGLWSQLLADHASWSWTKKVQVSSLGSCSMQVQTGRQEQRYQIHTGMLSSMWHFCACADDRQLCGRRARQAPNETEDPELAMVLLMRFYVFSNVSFSSCDSLWEATFMALLLLALLLLLLLLLFQLNSWTASFLQDLPDLKHNMHHCDGHKSSNSVGISPSRSFKIMLREEGPAPTKPFIYPLALLKFSDEYIYIYIWATKDNRIR